MTVYNQFTIQIGLISRSALQRDRLTINKRNQTKNKMSISQLSNNRLQISINTLNRDPTIPDSLKQTLNLMHQYLYENSLSMQIWQKQLCDKCNRPELNFGLSQKLSVVQFLQYFGKVQNLLSILENSLKQKQQDCRQCADQTKTKMDRIQENVETIRRQWERKRKIQELQNEQVRKQIKQINKKIEKLKTNHQFMQNSLAKEKHRQRQLQKQIQVQKQNRHLSANLVKNKNSVCLSGQYSLSPQKKSMNVSENIGRVEVCEGNNVGNWLNQIKQVQKYCEEMRINMQQLVHEFRCIKEKHQQLVISNNMVVNQWHCTNYKNSNFITFNQLRHVLSDLQDNLNSSLGAYISQLISKKYNPNQDQFMTKQSSNLQLFQQPRLHSHQQINQDNYVRASNLSMNKAQNHSSVRSVTNSSITFNSNMQKNAPVHKLANSQFQYSRSSKQFEHAHTNRLQGTPSFHCNQNKYNSKCLIQDLNNQLRTLNQTIKVGWICSLIGSKAQSSVEFISQTQDVNLSISRKSIEEQRTNKIFKIRTNSVQIMQKGFYQITCGFNIKFATALTITANENPIAFHAFNQIPKNNILCRAIMLYLKVKDPGCVINVCCQKVQQQEIDLIKISSNKPNTNRVQFVSRQSTINTKQIMGSQGQNCKQIEGFICFEKLS